MFVTSSCTLCELTIIRFTVQHAQVCLRIQLFFKQNLLKANCGVEFDRYSELLQFFAIHLLECKGL